MASESEYVPEDRRGDLFGLGVGAALLIAALIIALVAAVAFAVVMWMDDDESEGFNVGVTVDDVVDDPETYYGETVTISGEVNEVVHERAVTVGAEGFFHSDEVLVVSSEEIPLPEDAGRDEGESALQGDLVQVTGTVRDIEDVDFREDVDFDANVLRDFGGETVIVADNVTLNPRLDVPAGAITVEDVTDDEELFAGRYVNLTGEVGLSVSPQAFLLHDTTVDPAVVRDVGEQILVLTAVDAIPQYVVEDVPVEVSGTVRIYDPGDDAGNEAALEEEFGFDIEDGLLDGWEDDPVLIAGTISASDGDITLDIGGVAANAFAYEGDQITTGGVVEEVLTDQTFVLSNEDEDDPLDAEVLVVGQPDESIVPEAFVQVTGTVYVWDDDFEDEVGAEFPLLFEDDDTYSDYDEGVVIVAGSMTVER